MTTTAHRSRLRFSNFDQHQLVDVREDIARMFSSKAFVDGSFSRLLEERLSERYRRPVIVTNSGTTALILALDAMLKDKREVIVPSLTFSATIQAVIHARGVPVFVDVDEKTWTIDAAEAQKKINGKTGAILAVNLFGIASDVLRLEAIADGHKVPLIYDSCQAFGSYVPTGEVGTFGDIEAFSLDATKALSGGLGGFITIKEIGNCRRIRYLKNFGNDDEKNTVDIGINGRMSEFNAILALKSLETVEARLVVSKENVMRYKIALSKLPRIRYQNGEECQAQQYFGIFIEAAQETVKMIRQELLDREIETRIYNPTLLHKLGVFSKDGVDLPKTERMHGRILCLPTHDEVNDQHVETMIEILTRYLR